MSERFITNEMGHYRLHGAVKSMLQNTLAKTSTRYALEYVFVEENKLVATNGKKLIVIEKRHEIDPGLYHLTDDGFLLADVDNSRYPKYHDILLDKSEVTVTPISLCDTSEIAFSRVVYHLNQQKVMFDIFALQESLPLELDYDDCVLKTISPDHPFQLEFSISTCHGSDCAKVVYLQMPTGKKE